MADTGDTTAVAAAAIVAFLIKSLLSIVIIVIHFAMLRLNECHASSLMAERE